MFVPFSFNRLLVEMGGLGWSFSITIGSPIWMQRRIRSCLLKGMDLDAESKAFIWSSVSLIDCGFISFAGIKL